jgi:predicted Zn-dependent protease
MSTHINLPPDIDFAVRAFIRRNKKTLRWLLLMGVLLFIAVLCFGGWALYRGAAGLSRWSLGQTDLLRIPIAWERPLGDAALAQLRGQMNFITNPQVIAPLNRLAEPLQKSPLLNGERITVYLTDSPAVNAVALPGGHVVIFKGLIERAKSAEEVQGVLAHEIAHIMKRHAVIQLAQGVGLKLLLQQLSGGENQMLDRLVGDSGQLLKMKFSRDHERTADDLGWDLMVASEVDPRGMLAFFASLAAEKSAQTGTATSPMTALLSTHPAPAERLERLRLKGGSLESTGFRTFESEFRAIQAGLLRSL